MYPNISRRTLVGSGFAATAALVPHRPLLSMSGKKPQPVPPIEDPRLKELAAICLNAGRESGADYTDVRLTHTYFFDNRNTDVELIAIGVRSLVNGYWGFAASTVWSQAEAARLGQASTRQAKANGRGLSRELSWMPPNQMVSGHWVMPIKEDPFLINRDEISDYMMGIHEFAEEYGFAKLRTKEKPYNPGISCQFWKQDKAFASSEGQFCTQRLYRTSASINLAVGRVLRTLGGLTPAGLGFEHIRDQPLRDRIREQLHEMDEDARLPVMPIDVGRYSVTFDSHGVAGLISKTIGQATEADRVFGYEANAGGTSYITTPNEMIGSFRIGSKLLNISCDRTTVGGASTVGWDDEGVSAQSFPLIKDGILMNLQSSRESSSWIRRSAQQLSQPIYYGNGCMNAPDGLLAPLIHPVNLSLEQRESSDDLQSLLNNMENGIFMEGADFDMDFQQISGYGTGVAWEIKKGKKVARLINAGILFRTPEIWNSVLQIGSAASAQSIGLATHKGEPPQENYHSVLAPPMSCRDITFIDVLRKA